MTGRTATDHDTMRRIVFHQHADWALAPARASGDPRARRPRSAAPRNGTPGRGATGVQHQAGRVPTPMWGHLGVGTLARAVTPRCPTSLSPGA